jgi:hypothetical protein
MYFVCRVVKKGSPDPYEYRLDVLFLPVGDQLDYLGPQPDLAQVDLLLGMWKIGRVASFLLPFSGRREGR